MSSSLIMFDYDGVIADSREIFQRAFQDACVSFGLEPLAQDEAFLRVFEGNMMAGLAAAGLRETYFPAFLSKLEDMLNAAPQPPVFTGMAEVVRTLYQHFPLWIITSNVSDVLRPVLEDAGIVDCFQEIMGADVHPDKTEKIRRVRVRFPATCPAWYVGDTLGDILEGNRAGCRTVAVTWGWHSRDRLEQGRPDRWAERPADLLEIFGIDIQGTGDEYAFR